MARASVVEEAAWIKAANTECQQENDQEDRISKLPDDILIFVLDKLQPCDIALAAVVSKRWRHLTNLRSNIFIDVAHFIEGTSVNTLEELVRTSVSAVEAVKRILPHSNQSQNTLNRLGIRFYLRDESIDIVRSVDKAMTTRKVVKAEFVIITEISEEYNTDDDMMDNGRRLMTFVDACPRAFGGLTHLSLHSVRLGKSDFCNVLDTCKKLECLRLNDCDAGNKSVLKIEHSQLAELSIVSSGMERAELIWLPRLTHLTCRNWLPSQDEYPLSFHHVPQLQRLTLCTAGTTMHKTFVCK
ncbi:hypothetical protein HU200_032316 [Digitaria exilis]|uniref:F-box domain-containing protein n=1 Tax=Digitaria exilis TaxID=1010633 RepID=A0A835BP30_9POAL|nr:hypothetical protein HU200_032316 [Digitaria exilis]